MATQLDFATRQLANPSAGVQQSLHDLGAMFGQFQQSKLEADKVAKEEARYQTEQKRLGVLDARATQLWEEQQKEKENLLMAGQLKSNPLALQEAVLAQDPRFNTAMAKATNAGLDTGTMGVKGVMDWYGQQTPVDGINLSQGVPNVSGTAGSAITKNVSRQVPVSVPISQPVQGLSKPKVIATGAAAMPPRTDNTEWNARELNPFGKTVTMLGELHNPSTLLNKVGSVLDPTKLTLPSLSNRRELNLEPQPVDKQIKAEYKANQVLAPQTPKQQETSKTQMKTVMEKVVTGHTSGTPPKLNQIEAATIDKLFAGIDPNAQSRDSAKTAIEGLYYSLGLNPKQVKEYAEGTVESVYGDKNDPIKLALANAKLDIAKENVKATNTLGMEMYKEGQANYRQSQTLAQSAQQHREKLLADKANAKLPPGWTIGYDGKPTPLSALSAIGSASVGENTQKGKRDIALAEQMDYEAFVERQPAFRSAPTKDEWIKAGKPLQPGATSFGLW